MVSIFGPIGSSPCPSPVSPPLPSATLQCKFKVAPGAEAIRDHSEVAGALALSPRTFLARQVRPQRHKAGVRFQLSLRWVGDMQGKRWGDGVGGRWTVGPGQRCQH